MEGLFIVEESLQWSLKGVNESSNKYMTTFLVLLTGFISECAYVRFKQEKLVEAGILFDILYKLAEKIVTSSTNVIIGRCRVGSC